jgi:hypothetical protein
MGLKTAANYFVRTPIYGWNGTTFVPTGAKGALDPYDRFVSEREFGLKRRMLLVNPDSPNPLPLAAVARIELTEGPAEIRRADQERVAIVAAPRSGGQFRRACLEGGRVSPLSRFDSAGCDDAGDGWLRGLPPAQGQPDQPAPNQQGGRAYPAHMQRALGMPRRSLRTVLPMGFGATIPRMRLWRRSSNPFPLPAFASGECGGVGRRPARPVDGVTDRGERICKR